MQSPAFLQSVFTWFLKSRFLSSGTPRSFSSTDSVIVVAPICTDPSLFFSPKIKKMTFVRIQFHTVIEKPFGEPLSTVAEIQLFEWRVKGHQFSGSGEMLLFDVFCWKT